MTISPTVSNPLSLSVEPAPAAQGAGLPAVWGPLAALTAALLVQGAASRPAPQIFRPEVEGVVALLLTLAVGWRRPLSLALGARDGPRWIAVGAACLAALLWIPLARGAWAGWPAADVVRDVVPLLFIFLPLALVPALKPTGWVGVRILAAALMLEGLFLVLRWWNRVDWGFGAVGVRVMPDGDGYLLNAPSALFAAVAWPLAALHCAERGGWRGWIGATAALSAGALCVAAQLGAAHRLAFGLIVLTGLTALWTRGRRISWLLPLLATALVVFVGFGDDRLVGAVGRIVEKTRLVGGNARLEEAAAALAAAGENLGGALLGAGWGARLENPAVGGWRVAYTHTFVTYLLFKAGVVGLATGIVWFAVLAPAAARAWRRDAAWALAVIAPLAVALTAHTSYKYLDTGVLLSLLILSAAPSAERN